jgi:hypothetical protein
MEDDRWNEWTDENSRANKQALQGKKLVYQRGNGNLYFRMSIHTHFTTEPANTDRFLHGPLECSCWWIHVPARTVRTCKSSYALTL